MGLLNTISRKVFVGYAAILLIQLVSALTLFYKLENINEANDQFVEKSLPTLQAVKQASSALNHMLIGAYGLYGYTLSLEEFEAVQQTHFTKLNQVLPRLTSVINRNDVDIDGFNQQLSTLAGIMSNDEVDWDRARGVLTELQSQSAQIEAQLIKAEKSVSVQANEKVEHISTDIDVIIVWLVVGLLLATAIIVSAFVFARKTIVSPVKSLSLELDRMVETQDLRQDIGIQTKDEVGIAGRSINKLLQAYRKVNGDINETGLILQDSIGLLNHSAELSEQEIENLRAIVESLLSEISRLEARISDAASRSESASGQAFTGAEQVTVGSENIANTAKLVDTLSNDIETSAQMLESLKQSGDKVSSVVKTIADIAEQTNLLALNAAIEAARAGESGRGFAVVAGEVRALASRTHDSTHEINSILEEIVGSISATVSTMEANQLKAGEAVGAAEETVASLQKIKDTVLGLSDINHELADLGQASQAEVGKMRDYVDNINEAVATVTTTSGETRQASQSLNDLGSRLQQVLQQFRT